MDGDGSKFWWRECFDFEKECSTCETGETEGVFTEKTGSGGRERGTVGSWERCGGGGGREERRKGQVKSIGKDEEKGW